MNSLQLFEKQLSELTEVLNKNLHDNKEILDIIKWCRDEYLKLTFIYPGDYYVLNCIKHQAFNGLSLTKSIEAAKNIIIEDIKIKKFNKAIWI